MRDRRFVAAHRGGPLDRESHRELAFWAARCARASLPLFSRQSEDLRPARALEVAVAWSEGKVPTGDAMRASVAAHAAARAATDPAAVAAARAAGQAVATAHCSDHSMGGLLYALKAFQAAGIPAGPELQARLALLPGKLRPQVEDGVLSRLKSFGIEVS